MINIFTRVKAVLNTKRVEAFMVIFCQLKLQQNLGVHIKNVDYFIVLLVLPLSCASWLWLIGLLPLTISSHYFVR